jgi:uncharacterized protein YlxW (UPF0749 family)
LITWGVDQFSWKKSCKSLEIEMSKAESNAPVASVLERMTQAVKNAHTAIQVLKTENTQLKEDKLQLLERIKQLERELTEAKASKNVAEKAIESIEISECAMADSSFQNSYHNLKKSKESKIQASR